MCRTREEWLAVYRQALIARVQAFISRPGVTQGQVAGLYALLLWVTQPYMTSQVWKEVALPIVERWPGAFGRIKAMAWEMVDVLDGAYNDALPPACLDDEEAAGE